MIPNSSLEYGGTPRKMYVALSALANRLGPAPNPLRPLILEGSLHAYPFETGEGALAVVWSSDGRSHRLRLGDQVTAKDLIGNTIG